MSDSNRFECTRRGIIASSHFKLMVALLGLAAMMLIFAAWTWSSTGRWVPTALGVVVAGVCWTAWRMSGDLAPLWLELNPAQGRPAELVVQMKRARTGFALDDIRARRLGGDERRHLGSLASIAGLVVGTGGFDSRHLGEFDLFATDLTRAVLVETGDQRLVVTPDDVDRFLDRLGEDGLPTSASR